MRNRRETMSTGASSGGTTLISSETTVKGDITFTGPVSYTHLTLPTIYSV